MFPALDWFHVGANYVMHLDLLMAFQPRRVLGFLLVVFLGSDETSLSLYVSRPLDLYSRLAVESPRQTYTPPATHRHIKVHHAFPFIGAVRRALLIYHNPTPTTPFGYRAWDRRSKFHYSHFITSNAQFPGKTRQEPNLSHHRIKSRDFPW